jgi:cytochrome P450
MTMASMRAVQAPASTSSGDQLRSRSVLDTCELPHPPYRVPFLGDVLGLNPRTPFQSSLSQTRNLGPISARRMLGTEMVAVSGLDLVAEVHDESRFGKYVGHHLTPLREIIGDALITVETDHPNWQLAHDILKSAFSREAMRGYHTIMVQVIRELLDRWDAAADGGHQVDVTADMTRLALESIGRAGFGYRFGSFDRRRPHPFISAMNRMLRYANWSTVPPLARPLRPGLRHSGAVMGRIVDEVIQARRGGARPETHDLLDLMLHAATPPPDAVWIRSTSASRSLRLSLPGTRPPRAHCRSRFTTSPKTLTFWRERKRRWTRCGAGLLIPSRPTPMSRSCVMCGRY